MTNRLLPVAGTTIGYDKYVNRNGSAKLSDISSYFMHNGGKHKKTHAERTDYFIKYAL